MFKRRCRSCGLDFKTPKGNYYYCSYACYQKAAIKERQCLFCGKSYMGPSWKSFCSRGCRTKGAIQSMLEAVRVSNSGGSILETREARGRLPFVPEIVAAVALGAVSGANETSSLAKLLQTRRDNGEFTKLLLDSPGWFGAYIASMEAVGMEDYGGRSLGPNSLANDFRVDAGAALRTLMLAAKERDSNRDDPAHTIEFRTGMRKVESVVSFFPERGFRRCISCHLVGNESLHFRKTKVQGRWAHEELCIYCSPQDWYRDLHGG